MQASSRIGCSNWARRMPRCFITLPRDRLQESQSAMDNKIASQDRIIQNGQCWIFFAGSTGLFSMRFAFLVFYGCSCKGFMVHKQVFETQPA